MASRNSSRAVVPTATQAPAVISPEKIAAAAMLMDAIPDADETGDGIDGIISTLLTVTDVQDLDAPWRSAGLSGLINEPIEVRDLRKRPSEYPGGIPFYLVITGAVLATGEVFTATSGAVSIVLQLAKAAQMGALPLRCIVREADRPSASGNFPQHLEVLRG